MSTHEYEVGERSEKVVADESAIPVLHIFACWEFDRRMPEPGERAACGWVLPGPAAYTPARSNEHKACVVCMEVTGQNRLRRRVGRWFARRVPPRVDEVAP